MNWTPYTRWRADSGTSRAYIAVAAGYRPSEPTVIIEATTKADPTESMRPMAATAMASPVRPASMTGRGPKRSMSEPPTGESTKPSRPIQAKSSPTVEVGMPRTWAR